MENLKSLYKYNKGFIERNKVIVFLIRDLRGIEILDFYTYFLN
jgi:hypothetical protein